MTTERDDWRALWKDDNDPVTARDYNMLLLKVFDLIDRVGQLEKIDRLRRRPTKNVFRTNATTERIFQFRLVCWSVTDALRYHTTGFSNSHHPSTPDGILSPTGYLQT